MFSELLTIAITFGLVLAFVHIMGGRFLEVKVIKQELDASRDATLFLQALLTRSDILVKDSIGSKIPYVVNNTSLTLSNIEKFYLNNFPSVEFKLEIFNSTSINFSYQFDFLNFNFSSACLSQFYKPVFSDTRILLCNDSLLECYPATARIIGFRSPLTLIADELSKACIRKRMERVKFVRYIPIDYSQIARCPAEPCCGINITDSKICSCIEIKGRKKFVCFPTACKDDKVEITARYPSGFCDYAVVNSTGFEVFLEIPADYIGVVS